MVQNADDVGGGAPRFLRVLPGGASGESQDKWVAGIVIASLALIILARRGIAKGSAGHLHVSAADGMVTIGYMVIGLAALKTVAVRYADSPAGQALAWIVA